MENSIKLLFVCFLLAILSCGRKDGDTASCIPSALQSDVIAFYPFSNGMLDDLSGNNQDLTNTTTASATEDRNGNANCAYEFHNSLTVNDFLIRSNPTFLNGLTEFSVSLWYETLDPLRNHQNIANPESVWETLISRDALSNYSVPLLNVVCPDRTGQWSINLYDCRRAVFGRTNSVWDISILGVSNCAQEVPLRTDTTWHHLVATFSQSANKMAIYRDGLLQESKGLGDPGCFTITPIFDIGDLFLGRFYRGKMDDVIIFKKELTQSEVTSVYNMTTCCETTEL